MPYGYGDYHHTKTLTIPYGTWKVLLYCKDSDSGHITYNNKKGDWTYPSEQNHPYYTYKFESSPVLIDKSINSKLEVLVFSGKLDKPIDPPEIFE